MIINDILTLIYNIFDTLFDFQIPPWDGLTNVIDYIDLVVEYGLNIYKYFIPPAGQVMLTLVVTVELVVDLYFIVLWVLKKIPMINIH